MGTGVATFYFCTKLGSVTILNGVATIGSSAFDHCSSLTSITIPNSATTIGSNTFASCTSLTQITANHETRQTISTVRLADGRKYLTLTLMKSRGDLLPKSTVEVSPNLIDWLSGKNHTTIITDDATLLKVRDNTPLTPGTMRYIRLNQSSTIDSFRRIRSSRVSGIKPVEVHSHKQNCG